MLFELSGISGWLTIPCPGTRGVGGVDYPDCSGVKHRSAQKYRTPKLADRREIRSPAGGSVLTKDRLITIRTFEGPHLHDAVCHSARRLRHQFDGCLDAFCLEDGKTSHR